MKNISYFLTLMCIVVLVDACTIKKFSSNQLFYKALHDENMTNEELDAIVKNSQKTAEAYSATRTDTKLVAKLRKFNEGCYMVKIIESETSVAPEKTDTISLFPHRKDSEKIIVDRGSKMRKDTIVATVFKINNSDSVKIEDASKIIYLVFLDNNRVLFHSPYKKKLVKHGSDSLDLRKRKYFPQKPMAFVSETEEFFKLGSDYEYNSVMRGYYKINSQTGLSIWMETYIEKKKIVITRLNFRYVQKENKIESLRLQSSYFRDSFININQTFEKFDSLGIDFKYYSKAFNVLMLKDKNLHIISKINQKTDTREYISTNSYDCANGCKKINEVTIKEQVNKPFTF